MNGSRKCTVVGCGRIHKGHGLCHSHLESENRGHDRSQFKPFLDTDLKRFLAKITIKRSGHWMWNAATASEGRYGMATFEKRIRPAHVVSWLLFRGPVPEWADDVDHLCKVTLCVNPDHLDPKTHGDNVLTGNSPTAINARKTHCKRGHEFTEENTCNLKAGGRGCRECSRLRPRYYKGRERRIDHE